MLVPLVLLVFCQTILADLKLTFKPFYDVNNYEVVGRHFENFIKTHEKQYDHEEKIRRFHVFIENLKVINEWNRIYNATYDVNRHSDLTKDERASVNGFKLQLGDLNGDCKVMGDPTTKDAPDAFDWRDHGAVSPVKKQLCGDCWAFSATALVESRCWAKNNQVILSEQQLVDCDKQSNGCNGGLMTFALTEVIKQGGQESEADYPYKHKDGRCRFDSSKIAAKVASCTDYTLSGEDALKELLFKQGPLSIAVHASNWLYKSGIFDNCDDTSLDHGVLLVGYGTENGEDFWIIKNSWGTDFGENGYIRIKRGVHCCGIAANVAYATVSAVVA